MNSLKNLSRVNALCPLVAIVILTGVASGGCDSAATPTPQKPAPQPTTSAPVSTPVERPTPTTSASTQPDKQPAPTGASANSPAEPDISKLPDRTQRLIRDTRKALAAAPGSGDLPTKLGMMYLTNDMERESIPLFRQAIERIPTQTANWYYLGLALDATRDTAGAIAAFQKAVTLDKGLLFAHLRLADLLLESDRNAALAEYQEVERLAPTTADTLVRVAQGYDKLGKTDEALAACRKAIELEPRCPLGYGMLADLLAKKGDEAGAREQRRLAALYVNCSTPPDMLSVAARATGHPTRAGIMRAMALANMGNFDIAIRSLRNLSVDDPMNLDIPLALGQVYQIQGDMAKAMNEYGQILVSDPGHIQAATNHAGAQMALGRLADAEKTLKAALAKHPDNPELLQSLSVVQARSNRLDEAKANFRRAIELKKGDPATRLEFAKLLLGAKQYSEALNELEPLMDTPLQAKALITRSSIKGAQADSKGAEEDLRAALTADPNDPEPFTSLGVLFASARQYDRAIAILEDGIKRYPKDFAIANALAWLLATAPQPQLRNGARAAELAKQTCTATNNVIHGYLDTLAAAFAELGKFDEAVTACQRAIDITRNTGEKQVTSEYESRLALYSARKTYRLPE